MHRTRNAAYSQGYRGFESPPFRQFVIQPRTPIPAVFPLFMATGAVIRDWLGRRPIRPSRTDANPRGGIHKGRNHSSQSGNSSNKPSQFFREPEGHYEMAPARKLGGWTCQNVLAFLGRLPRWRLLLRSRRNNNIRDGDGSGMMKHDDYPALFLDSDDASNMYQRTYLRLIRGEYVSLFFAALFSMSFMNNTVYYVIYVGVFVVGLFILVARAQRQPEQWWYRCRALAESVKTLTWRYMMHAAPFDGEDAQAKVQFRDQLNVIFRANIETAKRITDNWSGNDQITRAMELVRAKSREDRMAYYLKNRVEDQRDWYQRKSKANRSASFFWVWASGFCYVIAGSMALSRIALPNWQYWPIEPLIVVAASIVGWMQIKKFNELSATYTVTAHEIGMIQSVTDNVKDDERFSEFVNDAEKAFSREHTLWLARQSD